MRRIFFFLVILLLFPVVANAETKTFNFTMENNTGLNFEGGYYVVEVLEINIYPPKFVKVNLTTGGTSKAYNLYDSENPYLTSPFNKIDIRATSILGNSALLRVDLPSDWNYPERYTINRAAEASSKNIPNIVLTKSVDRTNLNVGDIAEFKIIVENTGNATASNLTLTEQLPNGFSKAVGSRFPPAINSELAAGASQELYYALKAVDPGTFNIEPAVVNYGSNTNKSNSLEIVVSEAVQEKSNLTIDITFDKNNLKTDEQIQCVVKISNTGKVQAKSVLVDGKPPSGVEVVEGDLRQVYDSINSGEQKEYSVILKAREAGNYSIQLRTVYNDDPIGITTNSGSLAVTKKEENLIIFIVPIILIIVGIVIFTIRRHKEYKY